MLRIAAELQKRPAAELATLTERLREHAARAQGTTAQAHRMPCPLLEQNRCTVYELRPASCRKAHSLDVKQCATPGADIPQSLDLLLKAEALGKGSAGAYAHMGLAATGHELGQAVLLALSDATAEERWMAGQAVFDTIGSMQERHNGASKTPGTDLPDFSTHLRHQVGIGRCLRQQPHGA